MCEAMKIGIITFHWATNYGAVLQAYALQSFLMKLGHAVQIIDYKPRIYEKKLVKCFKQKRPWLIKNKLIDYFKEQPFILFRKEHFRLTTRYHSLQELRKNPPECDVYICGSDQIWNPSFTKGGEGQPTTSYFLDFGHEKTIRIAYAVSFGCTEYQEEIRHIVSPVLTKFNAISVREKSGYEIVRNMGFDNVKLMPDPTLLLTAQEYNEILDSSPSFCKPFNFFYAIQDRQLVIKKMEHYFRNELPECVVSTREFKYSIIDIREWLSLIKAAHSVVTNSFHGIVFSIIYKKPFIAVPVEGLGSGMNDRIFTLLEQLGLKDRILNNCEPSRITAILSEKINWAAVEEKIQILRGDAELFLSKNIHADLKGKVQTK